MKTLTLTTFLLGIAALPAQNRELGPAVSTTLTAIRAEPQAYKGVKVNFTIQFVSLGRLSNPFFTKFTPSDFANFYAWGDEQPIWRQDAYEDLFSTLFLSKFSNKLNDLYKLETYDRVRVTGVIRDTFQGRPWIEVLDFTPQSGRLDTAVLTHMYRGEKLMTQRSWQRAIAELSLVPDNSMPATVQQSAYKNLGICLLRLGEADTAASYLASAQLLDKGDKEVGQLLAMARSQPDQAIDRTVDARDLKDHERPMWEAFEERGASTSQLMQ
ncbi:MAG: hypothetical protein KDC98_24540 [Planctomycetes bacterium]|nr:hypothetical protein [Planctomycetota bacterium]